jgi:hypothetical protein
MELGSLIATANDAYAQHAGEQSFRDFFRLPPTKENRSQLVDPAWRIGINSWIKSMRLPSIELLLDCQLGGER